MMETIMSFRYLDYPYPILSNQLLDIHPLPFLVPSDLVVSHWISRLVLLDEILFASGGRLDFLCGQRMRTLSTWCRRCLSIFRIHDDKQNNLK